MPQVGRYGPLPTIASDKRHGVTGIVVYCRGLHCSRSKSFTFDELGLPDDTPVIDIGKLKRFVCSRPECGCRDVEVRSEWPDPREVIRKRSME